MKKNIIIGILILTNGLFLLYGYKKILEADELMILARQQEIIADQAKEEAQKQLELALENARIAREMVEEAANEK